MKTLGFMDQHPASLWIQELEDGLITPENHARLMHLMRTQKSVRELYLKHAELTALIHQSAASRIDLGTMPVSIETLRREKRRSAVLSLSYAAAALILLGIGLLMFQVSWNPQASPARISLESSLDANYAVVRDEPQSQPNKDLLPGDQITLKRGMVRLRFPSGVEALVEGPSQFELISETTVRMAKGMGWFRVPENARGFTVRTERGQVIDLGTEFGIRFDNNEDLEVHVAVGRVKVNPSIPGSQEIDLVAGQAMLFNADGESLPTTIKSSFFRRQFSEQIPHIHWSFDSLTGGVFPANGTLPGLEDCSLRARRLDGSPVQPDDCLADGMFGKSFSMKGDGLFASAAFPGNGDCNTPCTVAAWVRHRGAPPHPATTPPITGDPRTGLGATSPFGKQSYLLNYTNAGLTTTQGATGEALTAGVTYTLTFHAAALPETGSCEYHVELVAFEPSDDDVSRMQPSSLEAPGTVLAMTQDLVTTSDMSARGIVSFTPLPGDPNLDKELGIRLLKGNEPVLYDKLCLTIRRGTARETVVLTESFESPVVTGYAEQTLPAQGWIGAVTHSALARRSSMTAGYGATRHGIYSQQPVFSTPYCAWGSPQSGPQRALFTLPTQPIRWSVIDSHGFHDSPPSSPVPSDEWTHVATVHTGRIMTGGQPEILIFIDGFLVETGTFGTTGWNPVSRAPSDDVTLLIGALHGAAPGDPTLDGDIDELHILRTALGEQEIGELMDGNQVVFRRK